MGLSFPQSLRNAITVTLSEYRRVLIYRGTTDRHTFWTAAIISGLGMMAAFLLLGAASEVVGRNLLLLFPLVVLWVLWVGTASTARRLRDAGSWPWLVILNHVAIASAAASWWFWAMIAGAGMEPGPAEHWMPRILSALAAAFALVTIGLCLKPSAGSPMPSDRIATH